MTPYLNFGRRRFKAYCYFPSKKKYRNFALFAPSPLAASALFRKIYRISIKNIIRIKEM